jgi:hypothetical protein
MPGIPITTEYLQQATNRLQQLKLHPHERVERRELSGLASNDRIQISHTEPQELNFNQAQIPDIDEFLPGIEKTSNISDYKLVAFLGAGALRTQALKAEKEAALLQGV